MLLNNKQKVNTMKIKTIMKGETMKPNKDCKNCNTWSEYICFECEDIQVREKYPNVFYNDDCQWELKKEVA